MMDYSVEPSSAVAAANPVRTRQDWEAMRAAVLADPGQFHGDIAATLLHWCVPGAEGDVWLTRSVDGAWRGWDARTAKPVAPVVPTGFEALTVEAVRQLHEENATIDGAQSDRIAALEAENATLRDELAELRAMVRALSADRAR